MPIQLIHIMKITGVVVLSYKLIKKGQPAFFKYFFSKGCYKCRFLPDLGPENNR